MSLEEYEPNAEFVGRNFNAGEVIQLVLKARFTGRWLPFEYVQMVMMHELAHCKQMNHSRAFWAVRNQYAEQVRQLWARGYTGEGIWGRGTLLTTGSWEANTIMPDEPLPEHLCGGTYRSRRRGKRKAKQPELSYQERKERRILKKFGANGVALGEDQVVKAELEKGKRTAAKPRVARSKRGRELRAAAALARFDQLKQPKLEFKPKSEPDEKETLGVVKKETEGNGVARVKTEADVSAASEAGRTTVGIKEEDISTASESETEDEGKEEGDDYHEVKTEPGLPDAVDIDGKTMRDGKGRGMVKVCEDENPDDEAAKQELAELRSSFGQTAARRNKPPAEALAKPPGPTPTKTDAKRKKATHEMGPLPTTKEPKTATDDQLISDPATLVRHEKARDLSSSTSLETPAPSAPCTERAAQPRSRPGVCVVCSFVNEAPALCCGVCSNVLDPAKDKRAWRCSSDTCAGGGYVNAGDCGICGVCGSRRST